MRRRESRRIEGLIPGLSSYVGTSEREVRVDTTCGRTLRDLLPEETHGRRWCMCMGLFRWIRVFSGDFVPGLIGGNQLAIRCNRIFRVHFCIDNDLLRRSFCIDSTHIVDL